MCAAGSNLLKGRFGCGSTLGKRSNGFCFNNVSKLVTFSPGSSRGVGFLPPICVSGFDVCGRRVAIRAPGSPLGGYVRRASRVMLPCSRSGVDFSITLLDCSAARSGRCCCGLIPLSGS